MAIPPTHATACCDSAADRGRVRPGGLVRFVATALAVLAAAPARAEPTITNLGVFPGGAISSGHAVTSSQVVVGTAHNASGPRAFLWTADGGLTDLDPAGGFGGAFAQGASADGSVVAGRAPGWSGVFRWTAAEGMTILPIAPPRLGNVGISGDGQTVVGMNGIVAARWTVAGGAQSLGSIGGPISYATAANASGGVVVGWSGEYALGNFFGTGFRWTGSMAPLNRLPGHSNAEAYGVSPGGSVAVGYSGSRHGNPQGIAVRWIGSTPQSLGPWPHGTYSCGLGVNADGTMVVGEASVGFASCAFLWTPSSGMVDLNEYLPTIGVDLTGWDLTVANAISPDGAAITGTGLFNGEQRGWVVTGIPAPGTAATLTLAAIPVARRRRR